MSRLPVFNIKNSLDVGATSIPFDDPTIVNFLGDTDSQYISAKEALENSDIYSAVFQLSGDLATAHLTAGKQRWQKMIDAPSATANKHSFWQAVFAQLLLGGEAFVYRWRNVNGIDVRWEYLRPSQVSAFLLNDGTGLTYNATFDEPGIGVINNIPQNDMLHFRLLSKTGGMTGVSPLKALTQEFNIKKSSNKLTLTALKQALVSPGILKMSKGGLLNWKQKAARSKEFMRQAQASNNGPIVIDDLEDYRPLEIKSDVAKLLAQSDWTGTQIAKVFGIPNSYLNGQGDQQSSIDQIKGMYANALSRYMESVTSELSNKLSTTVTVNLRPALDPLQDGYASTLANLVRDGVIAHNQATFLLKETGYFPETLPDAEKSTFSSLKGGEQQNEDPNQGTDSR